MLGVSTSKNNLVVEWGGSGRVVFSFAQRGNALSAHYAANKEGARNIKQAINDFCDWAFYEFEWCTMIMAMIQKESVERIVKKCGFVFLGECKKARIYVRVNRG